MGWKRKIVVGLGLAVLLWTTSALGADDPKGLVVKRYAQIETIISGEGTEDEMREQIKVLMEEFVDYRELSRLTVKTVWEELKSKEQAEFISLFKQLIQHNYAKRFKKDSELTVTYEGEGEIRKGKARLATTVESGDVTADVEYRMHKPEGKDVWWVYDIVIDEVSMMRNYRTQFRKTIKKSGVKGLFKQLRENVAERNKK